MKPRHLSGVYAIPSPRVAQPPRCPLCGARVLYQGITSIECAGAPREAIPERTDYAKSPLPIPAVPAVPACANYRVPVTPEIKLEFGDWAWACFMAKSGHEVEYYQTNYPFEGYWTLGFPECMANTGPSYRWRLRVFT